MCENYLRKHSSIPLLAMDTSDKVQILQMLLEKQQPGSEANKGIEECFRR